MQRNLQTARSTKSLQNLELPTLSKTEIQELKVVQVFDIRNLLSTRIRSFEELSKVRTPDLDSLLKFEGEDESIKKTILAISSGLKGIYEMDQDSILTLAEEMVFSYPSLKLSDIKLISRMSALGRLGELYSDLRVDRFFGENGYVSNYLNKKAEYIEMLHRKRKAKTINELPEKKGVPMPEKYKDFFKKIGKPKNQKFASLAEYYCHNEGKYFAQLRNWIRVNQLEYNASSSLHKLMTWKQFRNRQHRLALNAINNRK